jgi:hypothetical protein
MRFPLHLSRRTSTLRLVSLLGLGLTLAACSSPEQAPAGDTGTAATSASVAPAGGTSLDGIGISIGAGRLSVEYRARSPAARAPTGGWWRAR